MKSRLLHLAYPGLMKSAVGQSRDSFLSAQFKFSLQLGPIVLGSECMMQCIFHRPDLVPPAFRRTAQVMEDTPRHGQTQQTIPIYSIHQYTDIWYIPRSSNYKIRYTVLYSHKMSNVIWTVIILENDGKWVVHTRRGISAAWQLFAIRRRRAVGHIWFNYCGLYRTYSKGLY